MKVTKIKGKDYIEVNERLKFFRTNEATMKFSLDSEFIELNESRCVIKAIIKDEEGRIVATGTAYEEKGAGMVNKTSYIENCETSAWGRALGNLGIGIDTSVASADEVKNAIAAEDKMNKPVKKVEKAVKVAEKAGFEKVEEGPYEMPLEEVVKMMNEAADLDQLKALWTDNWKRFKDAKLTILEKAKETNKKRLVNA